VIASLNVNANQPYTIKIYAKLKKDNSKQVKDTLTLNILTVCSGAIIAPPITKSSDWTLNNGDSMIDYSLYTFFNCPG
jgi:hypothetical protein